MDFVGIPCPQINVHTTIQQYHHLKLLLKEMKSFPCWYEPSCLKNSQSRKFCSLNQLQVCSSRSKIFGQMTWEVVHPIFYRPGAKDLQLHVPSNNYDSLESNDLLIFLRYSIDVKRKCQLHENIEGILISKLYKFGNRGPPPRNYNLSM